MYLSVADTHCLNPPIPPINSVLGERNPGNLTEVTDLRAYDCIVPEARFEDNYDLSTFYVECLPDGTYNVPTVWPTCLTSRIVLAFIF